MVRKAVLLVFCGALGALFALPGSAGATVFCVDTTPGVLVDNDSIDPSCEAPQGTLLSALLGAEGQAGTDTVLVGPGSYTLPNAPNEAEVHYASSDVIHLRGIGNPHLTMGGTGGSQTGINIFAGDGSSVEGLSLTIPANADGATDWGLRIGTTSTNQVFARDVHVDGPTASNAQAIEVANGGNLVDSTVTLPPVASPTNTAVIAASGEAALRHDTITADVGVVGSGNTVTVERSTITAWWGAETDNGTLVVRDSLIQVENRAGAVGIKLANDNNSSSTILGTIEGDTIVGGEGFNTAGIRVQANQTAETANATIADTVIAGPAKALQVWSDAEREAKATVLYSNYDPAKVDINTNLDGSGTSGKSTYLPTAVTNLAPGFVDAAGGDFHLAPGSALIDAGDPAAPAAGALDLDGDARALAGTCGAAAVRDVGADEFAPGCAPAGEGATATGTGTGTGDGSGAPGGPGGGAGESAPAPKPAVPDTTIALRGKHSVTTTGKSAKVTVVLGLDRRRIHLPLSGRREEVAPVRQEGDRPPEAGPTQGRGCRHDRRRFGSDPGGRPGHRDRGRRRVNRRLLIVDDHPGFRRTAARSLGAAGWDVVGEAADGEGALREAERCAPDLVLLDVGLPDISGIEVARRLHDRDPDLAIVVTSTHERADYGELATAAGARGFVSKLDLDGDSLEVLLESWP